MTILGGGDGEGGGRDGGGNGGDVGGMIQCDSFVKYTLSPCDTECSPET